MMDNEIKFSEQSEKKIQALLELYSDKRALLVPVLYIAQEEFKSLSPSVMQFVAKRLAIPEEYVLNTATFYTLLNKEPVGKYHIQVCTSLSCYLKGCDLLLERIKKRLGIEVGETTQDGQITLSEVSCLASCQSAPAIQINTEYYENLTPEKMDEILSKIEENKL